MCKVQTSTTHVMHNQTISRAVPDFGSGSGRNPALFPNPAPGEITPEPDSFAGF